jgi:hypothetical protein
MPNLEKLEIARVSPPSQASCPVTTVSHGFKKLKTLVLKDEWNRNTAFYLSFFRNVTWLEKLHLREAFELISQQTELKELAITIIGLHQWTVKNYDIQVISLVVNVVSELSETSKINLEQFVKSQKKIESFQTILYRN